MMRIIDISSLDQLNQFAKKLATDLNDGEIIYLEGDLGSGKTTLVQLILKNLNYHGRVKSPTYNLYESYQFDDYQIIHMDLYRMATAEELYYLGIEDIFNLKNIVFVEWPEKGQGVLPEASYKLSLEIINSDKRELRYEKNT